MMNKYKPAGFIKLFLAQMLELVVVATIGLIIKLFIIPDINYMYKKIINPMFGIAYMFYYTSILLTEWQATLGMQVFGIKLVNEHGNRVT